jgi:hypothetical protein
VGLLRWTAAETIRTFGQANAFCDGKRLVGKSLGDWITRGVTFVRYPQSAPIGEILHSGGSEDIFVVGRRASS